MIRGRNTPVMLSLEPSDMITAYATLKGNGTLALVCTSAGGMLGSVVASAAHSSTGVYAVTLTVPAVEVSNVQATVESSGTALWFASTKSVTAANPCTFTVTISSCASAGSPTLADLTSTEKLHLCIALKTTDVTRVRS